MAQGKRLDEVKAAIPDTGIVPKHGTRRGFASDGKAIPAVKGIEEFLYPKMPAPFYPAQVVKQPLAWRKNRYIQVFGATMGNHSISLYYCVWTNARFEEILAADPDFVALIEVEKGRLVDRATFLLNKNIGLVRNEAGETPGGIGTGSATLAKVVDGMKGGGKGGGLSKKGYKLTVSGLARPVVPPPATGTPPAA